MNEELLQYIWKKKLFNHSALSTLDGESIEIIHPGNWNQLSGPDFLEAKIKINDTLWVGSVEIHLNSSGWIQHGHESDQNYDNVILHVVYEQHTKTDSQLNIPTLELKGRIPHSVLEKHRKLVLNKEEIACSALIHSVNPITFRSWLDRLLVNRLERKAKDLELVHKQTNGDWLQAFFVVFAAYLGQNQNKLPFQQLALNLPIYKLLKMSDQPKALLACVMGVAGLLDKSNDESLIKEYEFWRQKHELKTVNIPWKFGKIRPGASPIKRLELLASLIPYVQDLQAATIHGELKSWLQVLQKTELNIGSTLQQILFINAIVPYTFFYAAFIGDEGLKAQAVEALELLEAEDNRITRAWAKINVQAENTADSQALIELYKQYCEQKNCVLCTIGQTIIG